MGMIKTDSGLEKMRQRFRIHEPGRLFFLKSPQLLFAHVDVKIIRYGRTSFHQESREIICGKSHSPNSPRTAKKICRPKCPPLSAPSGQSSWHTYICTYLYNPFSLRIWLSLRGMYTDIDNISHPYTNNTRSMKPTMICSMYIHMYIWTHMETLRGLYNLI